MPRPLAGLVALWVAVVVVLAAGLASAHVLDTASLSLSENAAGHFLVEWRSTSTTLARDLERTTVFPPTCRLQATELDCGTSGLVGAIQFPWIEGSQSRVIVRIAWSNGASLVRVVESSTPDLTVYGNPASSGLRYLTPIAVDYTRLGVEHILTGYDHLLFVFALALLVRNGRRLVASVTAFTLAHSISLVATVLGWVSLPSAPVETAIALSIVLVCAECLRPRGSPVPGVARTDSTLAQRAPWIVTFAFGLLHGLGFASALLAIGLPETHVPTALFFFNVGVELGQLAAIAAFLVARHLLAQLSSRQPLVERALVYAMGTAAATWSIERAVAMLTT